MQPSILIIDDEPLARRTVRQHLLDLGWTGPIAEAGDGLSAIAAANRNRPDLLFLDIVMPGANGLEVLDRLEYEPKVIFTTAFDQYAVSAFELGALDYLLKPFGPERFAKVLQRARAALQEREAPLFSRARESLSPGRPLTRIFVRDSGRIVAIPLASLERVEGSGDYVTFHTAGRHYLIYLRLADVEAHLAEAGFLRIHRSHLVNVDAISAIEPQGSSAWDVVLKSGARLPASRAGAKKLRELAL